MESLRSIDVIEGGAEPNAELKARLFREAGHSIKVEAHDDEICTITGIRGDTGETQTVSYSVQDALRAGLIDKIEDGKVRARSSKGYALPWEHHTRDMLWARAVTRLVRRLAPDALAARRGDPAP